ncbi:helix-turn-helix domain-containing protein [Terrimonas alba]|uniref:helix-turn-helix domain-containing protein n=1 Tax=Terrimonas alba TaxID=3349636 RepID=UPI0035F32169
MFNFYEKIVSDPIYHRQLSCGDRLITKYNCPLDNKMQGIWSQHNYIAYVMEGRKIWHTAHGSYDLRKGSCVFVRKGACIVEQFFESVFCIVLFFVSDEFVCDVLKSKATPLTKAGRKFETIMPVERNEAIDAFFYSMMPYFGSAKHPDPSLLELKFREIILTIADNPGNSELQSFFSSLLNQPQAVSLQQIMNDNYCYNLRLEEYAQLTNRSLSAFKRDFQKQFDTTPGKWLLEKRLNHAMHLLSNMNKTVSEAAFESGFENPSHFSRAFRQHFGVAPGSARLQSAV